MKIGEKTACRQTKTRQAVRTTKTANPKGRFGYQTVVLIQKGAKVDAFQVITGQIMARAFRV